MPTRFPEEKPLTVIRCARVLLCLSAVLAAACSNNSNRGITATVGVDTGVALTTAGSATSLLEAATLDLAATVENASDTSGVIWSVTGVGSLSAETATTATYNAPATVTGASTALITATSKANPTQLASVALIVLGSPQIDPLTLFPANVSVAYQADVSAAGGDAPFTWVVLSGTLPPGLALSGSTSSLTSIEGTPTTVGTYTFTLQTTDTLSRVATVALSMVVNPQAACVLSGPYTFVFSGFRGGAAATHIGTIQISSTGTITGEQDYKDPHRTTTAETLSSGTCVNRETNAGVLTLNAPSGQLVYNFAATPPDSTGVIQSVGLQLISSGSDSGSGHMSRQDPAALTGTAPAGEFAFGLIGVDSAELHFGTAGRFTSTAGTLSAGLIDSNATSPLSNAPLSGTISAPDANGRGTLTLLSGAQTSTFAYYLVNASKMFMIDIDATPNSTTATTRMSGQITAQVGDVGLTNFDNSALASPSIFSLFGTAGSTEPIAVTSLARLSNADATAGTIDILLDSSSHAIDVGGEIFTAQSYTVADNGRGTLNMTDTLAARTFAFYLDGTASGYVVEQGSASGSAGLLEAQFQGPYPSPPPSGIFPATLPNAFVSVTAFPQAPGPISLEPLIYLNYDALSSSFLNGSFAIDPTTGRGLGTITQSGVGTTSASIYIVSPSKMDLLRFGTRAIDGTIEFMTQD
jgi:hypothetical protein